MKRVGDKALSPEGLSEFFQHIGKPQPDFLRITPTEAIQNYIAECGGDPEKAIFHFAPPPSPEHPGLERRSTIKGVMRGIASPTFAKTWSPVGVA